MFDWDLFNSTAASFTAWSNVLRVMVPLISKYLQTSRGNESPNACDNQPPYVCDLLQHRYKLAVARWNAVLISSTGLANALPVDTRLCAITEDVIYALASIGHVQLST